MHRRVFAVVDVETTGFSPRLHDRVVEIAVVRTNSAGEILGQYHTLINPQRDIGPTHVHGITTRDVLQAPLFAEIAGDVLELLVGAVFVAHNVFFDLSFVEHEFRLAGCPLPAMPLLCTMRLASRASGYLSRRRLCDLCSYFGIELEPDHTAMSDALAACQLLHECIHVLAESCKTPADFGVRQPEGQSQQWPKAVPSRRFLTRTDARRRRDQSVPYLAELVRRLPDFSSADPDWSEYMQLLDTALEDRRLTRTEAKELMKTAQEWGLGQSDVMRANERYVNELAKVAWEDGVITDMERNDLYVVADMLGVRRELCDSVLRSKPEVDRDGGDDQLGRVPFRQDIPGKTVCFTGTLQCRIGGEVVSRERAYALAEERGMIVKTGVSKKLDYLVASDPDSLSTKAKKARDSGVRIISERVFWGMLGIDIE